MNTFQITSRLEEIYPDIEGELCSKHTVQLNRVEKTYRKTYPMHPPTHYVISKDIVELAKTHNSSVSMALELGTIIMYSLGQEGGQLHISGNILTQDLVLQGSGKSINSQKQDEIARSIKSIIEAATEDLSLNRINGGFIYVHCQNSIEHQSSQHSLLIGLFMAIISLNELLEEYSQQELIAKLKENKHLKTCDVQAYFSCQNNRQLLVRETQIQKINLESKYKFLFLGLQFLDKQFYHPNSDQNYGSLIENLISNPTDIVSFFAAIEQSQANAEKTQILQMLSKIKEQLKIRTFILCQEYAVFLVETYRYAELIGKMSKKIHQHVSQIKAASGDNGGLINRFSSQVNISSIIFSSVPSKALAIFDPSDSLWF